MPPPPAGGRARLPLITFELPIPAIRGAIGPADSRVIWPRP